MARNLPAQTFWRRTIADDTTGNFVAHALNDDRWRGVIQCFDNGPAHSPAHTSA